MKKVLFGTKNPSKARVIKKLFEPLGLNIINLNDFGNYTEAKEDGQDPRENALQKAKTYFKAFNLPTFSIDSGLYIDKFPSDKQPGVFVRRINKDEKEATDQEMLDYYIAELNKVGGESSAKWVSSIALVVAENECYCQEFKAKTFFTSKASKKVMPGWPLSSIQIDLATDRYKSEMDSEERAQAIYHESQEVFNFMKKHIDKINL